MKYIRRKILQTIPVLIGVTIGCFLLLEMLPGDPAELILGSGATPENIEALEEELGLDKSTPEQYVSWVTDVARGDLGDSIRSGVPITELFARHVPMSLQLLLYAQIIALGLSIPLAVYSASRPNGLLDRFSSTAAFGFISIPAFVLGLILITIFAANLRWLPATGYTPFTENPIDHFKSMVLPSMALGLGQVALYFRVLRADMIQTLKEDWIMSAKAQGISQNKLLFSYALRPSSLTLLTVSAINVGQLVGGAFVIELLFAQPGLGRLIVESILARDFLIVRAGILVIAITYIAVNFFTDLAYALLDPRVRHDSTRPR